MRLGIYAITKNEERHVDRWLDAIQPELHDEDTITVCDTGSTDDTMQALMARGVMPHQITVKPWRFDVARNASLALVPANMDMVFCLDLDEVLTGGWRDAIERVWSPSVRRMRYPFIWSWDAKGNPGITYYADKIHSRHGYHWRLPCHEMLVADVPPEREITAWVHDFTIHHLADNTKSRRPYDDLMEVAIKEAPDDDRVQHYYARQLLYQGRMVEASEAFQRHLANPKAVWRPERSQSMILLSKVGGNDQWNHMWLMRAVAECPERRETWYELAKWEEQHDMPVLAAAHAFQAAMLPTDMLYLSDPEAQGDGPARLIARLEEKHGQGSAEVPMERTAGEGAATEVAGRHHGDATAGDGTAAV